MKKVKTIFFYIFVIVAICAAVFGYLYLKQNKKPTLNAIDVLPAKAICVISSGNFHELANKLLNQNLIWNELINVQEFNGINERLQFFDSLIAEVDELKEFFEKREVNIGIYSEKTSYAALITFNLKDLAQEKNFVSAIEKVLKCEVNNEGESEFWNGTLRFYLKVINGVVALSDNKDLVTQCFNSAGEKQSKKPEFSLLTNNLESNGLFNLYINHRLLSTGKSNNGFGNFILNGISACNIEVIPDQITGNGFNYCDTNSVLNFLEGQPLQFCDFFQILPFSTNSYKAISISNYAMFKKHLNIESESAVFWKEATRRAMFNTERQMEENINSKAIEVEFGINKIINKAIAVEIRDSSLVNEVLKNISDSAFMFQDINFFRLNDSIGEITDAMFGKIFDINAGYAFTYANYLVFTENSNANVFYMNSLLNNSSISQNELFMNYAKDNLLVNFNYQAYSSVNKQSGVLKNVFDFLSDSTLRYFNRLSDWSINICNYKNMLQFRTDLKYRQSDQQNESPGLWTCEADTAISSKPGLFLNHKSGENELLFQDAKNNLYLVNATGNVLWKKQILEPVLSEFSMVDAFKNNKYQILFNTGGYLHLIDRNGSYVHGFPVKLPAAATNSLKLLDYENNKEYRILIACGDNKIYNYNINGSKNEKFVPIRTENPVTVSVKYVKIGASDYLIVNDVEGKIYVYSRRGEGRIDLVNKLVTNSKDYYINTSNSIESSYLIYFDDKNSLLGKISLTDKKDAVKINAEFENSSYFFELIDDDKKMDIVVMDKSKLLCYDFSGNELFRFENQDENYLSAKYYYDSEGAYFILNNANNQIHIVQAYTKKVTKKISGSGNVSVYELFKDGKKYLLVADGKVLKCVLLK